MDSDLRRQFQVNACEAVQLYFGVDPLTCLHPQQTGYKPEMVYQIFEHEVIYGYKDLQIKIYICTGTGKTFVDISYSQSADIDGRFGLKPDDILGTLESWFPKKFVTRREDFIKDHPSNVSEPLGRTVSRCSYPTEERTTFLIKMCGANEPGFAEFHQKFEPLLIFYIEGANFLDLEDDRWTFLHIYEESLCGNKYIYNLAGFCTIYNFYKNVYNNRARISQILIFPPYRRQGLGTKLLTMVYRELNKGKANFREITVESPNVHFMRMRCTLDCKLVMELKSFSKENVRNGLSKEMLIEARSRANINPTQCNKVYNIMRILYTDFEDELDVALMEKYLKKRIYKETEKQYYKSIWRGGDKEKIEKLRVILNYKEIADQYLEREYRAFYRFTRPLVEQLKHYPFVQSRCPKQLLLQNF